MNDVRVIEGGGWYTATLASLPLVAGYGKTAEDAIERLRLELAALEYRLRDEHDRVRAALWAWSDQDGGTPIENLDLSVKIHNRLRINGHSTIESVNRLTDDDLLQIREIGYKSLMEIRNRIRIYEAEHGLAP